MHIVHWSWSWLLLVICALKLTCCTKQCLVSRFYWMELVWTQSRHIRQEPIWVCSHSRPASQKLSILQCEQVMWQTSHTGSTVLTCRSHRLVSMIWFTSSCRDRKGDLVGKRKGTSMNGWAICCYIGFYIDCLFLPLWLVEIWKPQTPLWLDQIHSPLVGWTGCTVGTTSETICPLL